MFASRPGNTSVVISDYTWLNGAIFCGVRTKHEVKQSLVISKLVHTTSYRFKRANKFRHPQNGRSHERIGQEPLWVMTIFYRNRKNVRWNSDISSPLAVCVGQPAPNDHIYVAILPCLNFLRKARHARCNRAAVLYLRVPVSLIHPAS
jgi:hypothetical protein